MRRVLLVNMPFANLRWPSLGLGLLKAALARRGIGCDAAYFNFDLAERMGLADYNWLADAFGFVLGGERLFAKHYFAGQLPDDEQYFREVLLREDPELSDDERRQYEALAGQVTPFLDDCERAVDGSRYALVGFTSSFQQTMASMCLARRIRQRWPEVTIVAGGAACEGPMGVELLRQFPLLDYVFLGEADWSFPALAEQVLAGGPVELPPGVAGRESIGGRVAECRELCNLDELPYPDFDDYFARLGRSPLAGQIDPLLFFETSRGCWWGEKHHCAFCGLNGSRLRYRSKDPARAVEELGWLARRHGVRRANSADNILDRGYFQTFLPMLKAAGLGVAYVFEMKTNLTRAQVELLLDSGLGAAQLGIETFSTPILRLVDKGTTAVQNLQALKWFSEAPIEVKWNFLWGFPGEDAAEYAKLAGLVPMLEHLRPPLAVGRVRMDRFAPYFNDPAAYGAAHARPHRAFRFVYPCDDESLGRLAYYFEYDYADGRNPWDYAAPLVERVRRWREIGGTVTLRARDAGGVLILHDTRPCATAFEHRLCGLERDVYCFCDTGRTPEQVAQFAAPRADAAATSRALDELLAARLMVRLDDRYVSLALWDRGALTQNTPARCRVAT